MRTLTVVVVLVLGIAWICRSQEKTAAGGVNINGHAVSEIKCGNGLRCWPMGDAVLIEAESGDYRLKPVCSFKTSGGKVVIDSCDSLQQKLWKNEIK